jgi:hypothetical protein
MVGYDFLCVLCVKNIFLRREHRGSYTQRSQSYLLKYSSAQRNALRTLREKKQHAIVMVDYDFLCVLVLCVRKNKIS